MRDYYEHPRLLHMQYPLNRKPPTFGEPQNLTDLPKRNPLHEHALTLEDLKVGLRVRRHHVRYPLEKDYEVGTILGPPFIRNTKYPNIGMSLDTTWMIPVRTTSYSGRAIDTDWYLIDMGVMPQMNHDNSAGRWNNYRYTLALD